MLIPIRFIIHLLVSRLVVFFYQANPSHRSIRFLSLSTAADLIGSLLLLGY